MSLTNGGTNLTARFPETVDSRVTNELGQNPGAKSGIGDVAMASVKAIQTVLTIDCGIVGLLGGVHCIKVTISRAPERTRRGGGVRVLH